jgi:hypothetical protein
VPKANIEALFDHLVGAGEQQRRDLDAYSLSGLGVDGKIAPQS